MKKSDSFSLRTVHKKIILISKLFGIVLILSYVFTTKLPLDPDLSFGIWVVSMILLVLIIDFLLGYYISKPVSMLNETARKMTKLDFTVPCPIQTEDEFGELAASLNTMADNLQQTLLKLETEVEKERMLLAERKELVENLSHEMKTPLGVIRAYAEGLQDEIDKAKVERYSEIIIAETERMSGLITTLLDLSALETGVSQLIPERFDLVELVETVAGRLLIDTPDENYELQYELPGNKVFVFADKARIEQVLDNLTINAKKNVKPGGILRLVLKCENERMDFSIFNQGQLISKESLEKIWTKFYRDSNSKGSGSGLGLAIVSQILSMQNFVYGVKNLSDGVEFYFSIPCIT